MHTSYLTTVELDAVIANLDIKLLDFTLEEGLREVLASARKKLALIKERLELERVEIAFRKGEQPKSGKQNILEEADGIVNKRARDTDRDDPVKSFVQVATIASAIRDKKITPRDATAVMLAVKLSRESHKHHRDNLVDLAGYTQIDHLLAEAGHD